MEKQGILKFVPHIITVLLVGLAACHNEVI